MNSLFTFGCSLTDEFGEEYINYKKDKLPDTWPKILSKLLGKDLINLGKAASSNYSIFRQFISISEKIDKNDILIFGWTSILRYSFNDIHNNLVDILPNHKNDFPSLKTHEEILFNRDNISWVNEIIDYIKLINLFCNKVECKVFHWTSDNTMTNFIYKNNSNLVDELRFIHMKELNYANMFDYLCDPKHYNGNKVAKIVDETNNLINDHHLGELGHKAQSKLFYEYIISQKTK
jgi:hypothetical protein